MKDDLLPKLQKILGNTVRAKEPMHAHTTLHIGGPAQYFFVATTSEELARAVAAARSLDVPSFVFGGGSNILVGDKGITGLVIRNASRSIRIKGIKSKKTGKSAVKTVYVEADSGVAMNAFVRFTLDEGLSGIHMHLGLPGTVGGALYMNSKWTRPEGYVGNALYQAHIIDRFGKQQIVPQSYFRFGYDKSNLQKTKEVVLSAVFALTADDKKRLWQIANETIGYRRDTQPQGVFSAGCAFRNLSASDAVIWSTPNATTSAGYLLDLAGMKGVSVNDAYISPDHANFIINRGHARACDVVELIERAQKSVYERFKISLAEEIERIGDF